MYTPFSIRILLLALPLVLAGVRDAVAQEPGDGEVLAGVRVANVSDGLGGTRGVFVRGSVAVSTDTRLLAEVVSLERFRDSGTYASAGVSHTLDDDWYVSGSVGSSDGGFFWPSLRVDAAVNRKWLQDRSLVTTVGVTYIDAKDDHSDMTLLLAGAWYLGEPWILQGGVSINESDPGSVVSASGFAVVNWFRPGTRQVSVRYEQGRQAYQLIAPDTPVIDFPFNTVTVTWREWLGSDWGMQLSVEQFRSDSYDQRGVDIGLFVEF